MNVGEYKEENSYTITKASSCPCFRVSLHNILLFSLSQMFPLVVLLVESSIFESSYSCSFLHSFWLDPAGYSAGVVNIIKCCSASPWPSNTALLPRIIKNQNWFPWKKSISSTTKSILYFCLDLGYICWNITPPLPPQHEGEYLNYCKLIQMYWFNEYFHK